MKKGRFCVETFILAAVSLIIAISLIIYKKNDPLQLSFASLCLAVFLLKAGSFCRGIFGSEDMRMIEYAGLIAIPPLTIRFCRRFLHDQTLFAQDDVMSSLLFGLAVGLLYFTSLKHAVDLQRLLTLVIAYVLLISYVSLLVYIKKGKDGVERRRMGYLAIAVPIAVLLGSLDILYYLGFDFPPLYNLVLAALLYFVLLIIAYPHLTELHQLMAKALLVSVVTAFAVVLFYLVLNLFGHSMQPPFTHVLVACFLIVISLSPFKILLEKVFSWIYPASKDVFTSLYELDAKLERERALLLEDMAPVFAHEIRNPLGSIKGAAQYLRSEIDTGENAKLLNIIIEEVDRLNGVVTHFLNYAKPHSLNLKEWDINAIIDKAIDLIRASKITENITISATLHPHIPKLVLDGEQLIQVILNMAFNAIDAMPDGGELSIETTKAVGENADAVDVVIKDTGRGIKQENIKNIFKPFFTTKERGVGLGLAVCHRIIRNHGGYIRVTSEVGRGTSFCIRLVRPTQVINTSAFITE
jgi:two-component system sensor histidine kinase HydH